MLESESQVQKESPRDCLIAWSDSGKAFRIEDVTLFSTHVLPKYFRTNKFSSFQRNLNLYGFSKVRRGPDADMYAHPSFLRGRPEILSELKKCKSAADRKRQVKPTRQILPQTAAIAMQEILPATFSSHITRTRAVSPSVSSDDDNYTSIRNMPHTAHHFYGQRHHFGSLNMHSPPPISQQLSHSHQILSQSSLATTSPPPQPTTRKLDLLTLAITCLDSANKAQA